MTSTTLRLVTAVALAAFVAAGAAPAAPPPIALSASPSVLALDGASSGTIDVTNPGSTAAAVTVSVDGYDIAENGRVEIDPQRTPNRTAQAWLSVAPAQLTLAPGATAQITVASHPPPKAEPGDHHALVLLTTRSPGSGGVGIRTRIGVGVLVRMAGAVVRNLAVDGVTASRGKAAAFRVTIVNHGNVNERLLPSQIGVTIRSGSKATTPRAPSVDLLPGARVAFTVTSRYRLAGRIRLTVTLRPAPATVAEPRLGVVTRTFVLTM